MGKVLEHPLVDASPGPLIGVLAKIFRKFRDRSVEGLALGVDGGAREIVGAGRDAIYWGFVLLIVGLPAYVVMRWRVPALSAGEEAQP